MAQNAGRKIKWESFFIFIKSLCGIETGRHCLFPHFSTSTRSNSNTIITDPTNLEDKPPPAICCRVYTRLHAASIGWARVLIRTLSDGSTLGFEMTDGARRPAECHGKLFFGCDLAPWVTGGTEQLATKIKNAGWLKQSRQSRNCQIRYATPGITTGI